MPSERKICVDLNWLKSIYKGMQLRTLSERDRYAGQLLTIQDMKNNANILDSEVLLLLEKKVEGSIKTTAKLWWIYEHCKLISP